MKTDKVTDQSKEWCGTFGKEYTDRNNITLEEADAECMNNYGITRTGLNNLFIGKLDRDIKILEVGINVGIQLSQLQKMGFKKLYGIEINNYAIQIAKSRTKNINIVQASALDVPFQDGYFDLVFTSGVLIHIAPAQINKVLREIHRCTREYIWGIEYYADHYTEVIYRGKSKLLWKTNFSKLYLSLFPDLVLVKEKKLPYLQNNNIDTMFLLRKDKCQR